MVYKDRPNKKAQEFANYMMTSKGSQMSICNSEKKTKQKKEYQILAKETTATYYKQKCNQ